MLYKMKLLITVNGSLLWALYILLKMVVPPFTYLQPWAVVEIFSE